MKSNRSDCESFRVRVVCVYVSLICVWLECVCVSFKYSFKKSCVLVSFRVLMGVRSRFRVRELCVIGVSRGWGGVWVQCMWLVIRRVCWTVRVRLRGDGGLRVGQFRLVV